MSSLAERSQPVISTYKPRHVTLRSSDGSVVCERCFVADRPLARMKGLLGRADLPAGEGILIRPCNSIHMFFMRFAIDAIFLDRNGNVLKIAANLKPWRAAWARHARTVVELVTSEVEHRGISVGDKIEIDKREEST